jgi:hypothetical protein
MSYQCGGFCLAMFFIVGFFEDALSFIERASFFIQLPESNQEIPLNKNRMESGMHANTFVSQKNQKQ